MIKFFMIITVFHSSIGHLNSEGRSKSVAFVPFETMADCKESVNFVKETLKKETKGQYQYSITCEETTK